MNRSEHSFDIGDGFPYYDKKNDEDRIKEKKLVDNL